MIKRLSNCVSTNANTVIDGLPNRSKIGTSLKLELSGLSLFMQTILNFFLKKVAY